MSGQGSQPNSRPGTLPFGNDPRRGCRDMDTSLFVPEHDPRSGRKGFALAEAACRRCPEDIRTDCKGWAIDHYESGFWGGTTDQERRRIREQRAQRRGAA